MAFARMIRAAERWCRVSINDLKRHQLSLLRIELGADPPPTDDHANRGRNSNRQVATSSPWPIWNLQEATDLNTPTDKLPPEFHGRPAIYESVLT